MASVTLLKAETAPPPSQRLLAPYGPEHFSPLFRQSVDALFTGYPAYRRGEHGDAARILEDFWKRHPPGSVEWRSALGEGERVARTLGVEYGDPPCYAALRMLTECAAWRRQSSPVRPGSPPLRFTVILIGQSHGIQPATLEELREERGQMARHTLDLGFRESPGAIIDDCYFLLFEYIRAFTGGRLAVQTRILPYPDLDVAMRVVDRPGQPSAELAPGALEAIWEAIDPAVKASTDWWYILYPSHRPEQFAAFSRVDFSNGGSISRDPESGAPVQVGDERVLVTKPPKYGGKPVAREERVAFFSAVMQHEFFHQVFWLYPQFQLEASGHQWFDRADWPADFAGFLEADYYAEALHKRILPRGDPPLWAGLRFALPAAVAGKIGPALLVGRYRHDPVTDATREGAISAAGGMLAWTDRAGKSWRLELSGDKRLLLTGFDNPYFESADGKAFRIDLGRGPSGEFLPRVAGFWFRNEFYVRLPDPP